MNIAFPAILFFVLTIPGLVYRYYARPSLPVNAAPMLELATRAVIPAAKAHMAYILLIHSLYGLAWLLNASSLISHFVPNYKAWFLSLSGASGSEIQECVDITFWQVALLGGYFTGASYLAKWMGENRGKRIDEAIKQGDLPRVSDPGRARLFSWLRVLKCFDYLLSKRPEGYLGQLMQFVCDRDDECYLYIGQLTDIMFSDDGEPRSFVLASVAKRRLREKHEIDRTDWIGVTNEAKRTQRYIVAYADIKAMVISQIQEPKKKEKGQLEPTQTQLPKRRRHRKCASRKWHRRRRSR